MALIILEGLDRTGKTTVAEEYKREGYEVIHMSAPPKELSTPGYVGPSYLDLMLDMLQQAAAKDILLDRSHYGEIVWPQIYGRTPHLKDEDYDILREMEESVGVKRIMMIDPDMEAHWQRCVANKEPLTKTQFLKARALYDRMATKYGFERKTLKDYIDVKPVSDSGLNKNTEGKSQAARSTESTGQASAAELSAGLGGSVGGKTTEVKKLELANAINDVLSKRILKTKNSVYDQLETDIRNYLNIRLGKIFGDDKSNDFSQDEVTLLKQLVKRLKDKENGK